MNLECGQVKRWTASELRKLPAAERDAIMEAAAVLAEVEYRSRSQPNDEKQQGDNHD